MFRPPAKLIRYFLTAGVAAVFDVGGFAALNLFPIPVVVSATTSFCVAAVVNYVLSSRYAFHRQASLRGFAKFFLAAMGGLAVNVSVTLLGSYLGLPAVAAKVLGVGTAFFVNFWINLLFVFTVPPHEGARSERASETDSPKAS